jgi:hypothetical protein
MILTTSILTVALSYQAFAQGTGGQGGVGQILAGNGLTDAVTQANVKVLGQELTQGIKTQTGQVLEECCKLLIHPSMSGHANTSTILDPYHRVPDATLSWPNLV